QPTVSSAVGLARLLQAVALHVEQPAVIAAADPARLDLAVVERGAAVGAARVHEPGPAPSVAEKDQILAEDPHLARGRAGVGDQTDGMPVAAQQLEPRLSIRRGPDAPSARARGRARPAARCGARP